MFQAGVYQKLAASPVSPGYTNQTTPAGSVLWSPAASGFPSSNFIIALFLAKVPYKEFRAAQCLPCSRFPARALLNKHETSILTPLSR